MDPQITQSEVRLNRALEQRGQMDQQMLEKFSVCGVKMPFMDPSFYLCICRTFISSFRKLLETANKFTMFLRRLSATEVDSK